MGVKPTRSNRIFREALLPSEPAYAGRHGRPQPLHRGLFFPFGPIQNPLATSTLAACLTRHSSVSRRSDVMDRSLSSLSIRESLETEFHDRAGSPGERFSFACSWNPRIGLCRVPWSGGSRRRTRSLPTVSAKREYSRVWPETFAYWHPAIVDLGVWRRSRTRERTAFPARSDFSGGAWRNAGMAG
jgi:hypothetical protein